MVGEVRDPNRGGFIGMTKEHTGDLALKDERSLRDIWAG